MKSYVLCYLGLGGLDIFDSILEKAASTKKPPKNDNYLPALEGCLEMLNLGDKMPERLLTEVSKDLVPVFEPLPMVEEPPEIQDSPIVIEPEEVVPPEFVFETPEPKPPPKQASVPRPAPAPVSKPVPKPVSKPVESIPEKDDDFEDDEGENEKTSREGAGDAGKLFRLGLKYYNLGKYKRAKKEFIAALEEDPKQEKAHLYIGLINFEEKEYQSARDHLQIFLEHDSTNLKATLTLLRIYKALEDWTGLVRICTKLGEIGGEVSPQRNSKIQRDFGIGLLFQNKFEDAKSNLESVIKREPADQEANFYLAKTFFHLNDFPNAEDMLKKLLPEIPQKKRLRNQAESLLKEIGELPVKPTKEEPPGASDPIGKDDLSLLFNFEESLKKPDQEPEETTLFDLPELDFPKDDNEEE